MWRPRTVLAATAAALLLPATFVAVVRHAALRARDFQMALDPFEIDLQLLDRND